MSKLASIDHATMREMNLTLILDTLRLYAPISRAGLALRTRLNKGSITSMVRDLIDARYVCEIETTDLPAEVGRPSINLRLNPEAGYFISAEIGVDFVALIVTDFCLTPVIQRYEQVRTVNAPEQTLQKVIDLISEIYGQLQQDGKVIFGIAVGLPGLVDMTDGRLLFAPNLRWQEVDVRARLAAQFDSPILVSNEANIAAFGEGYFGVGQQSRLLLYVSSGVGLGGGIISNGRLLTGVNGLAGEVGHMSINPDGHPCTCGNHGCWETEATQSALFRRVQEHLSRGRRSPLARWSGQLTVRLVRDAALSGDEVALAAFQETGCWLGIGMANLINALNPEHVVFGGSMSIAHDLLIPHMRAEIEKRALSWIWEKALLTTATHTADAALMGGVAMLHHHVIHHPNGWKSGLETLS